MWPWNCGQDPDRETEGKEVQADRWQRNRVALRPVLGAAMSLSHRVGMSALRSVPDCPPHPSCPCFSTVTRDPKALQVPPEGEPKKVLSLLPAEGEGNYDLNS